MPATTDHTKAAIARLPAEQGPQPRLHVRANQRQSLVSVEVQAWKLPLLAQKMRNPGSQFVVDGGVEAHVHILTELPATLSVS